MVAKLSEAQRKRLRAARLLQAGKTPAQVACAVGVARQTVYTWKRVLDERGIEGLRVCDASVFPDLVASNICATVFMVAERGAAFIASE